MTTRFALGLFGAMVGHTALIAGFGAVGRTHRAMAALPLQIVVVHQKEVEARPDPVLPTPPLPEKVAEPPPEKAAEPPPRRHPAPTPATPPKVPTPANPQPTTTNPPSDSAKSVVLPAAPDATPVPT